MSSLSPAASPQSLKNNLSYFYSGGRDGLILRHDRWKYVLIILFSSSLIYSFLFFFDFIFIITKLPQNRGKTTKIMRLLERDKEKSPEGKGEEKPDGPANGDVKEERKGRKILSLCPTPSSFSSRDCLWVFLFS